MVGQVKARDEAGPQPVLNGPHGKLAAIVELNYEVGLAAQRGGCPQDRLTGLASGGVILVAYAKLYHLRSSAPKVVKLR
jgi:hypothetical protein